MSVRPIDVHLIKQAFFISVGLSLVVSSVSPHNHKNRYAHVSVTRRVFFRYAFPLFSHMLAYYSLEIP
jgi:hypothetical protein